MSRKADIYQKGLTDLAKGSVSGTASMPSEIGQLTMPGFFSNLFGLKSKRIRPDKDPSLLDPKDRYAYQLKQAFPEKDAQYKVKGNFEDIALSMNLNPESAEAGFGSLISLDPISSSAKTAITIPKGLAELMPLIGGIIGGERAFKGTKFAKLFKTKMDTAKQMEKAGASKEEIAAVTELVELPDGRMVMWADHETTDAFKKKVPGIVGTSREGKATIETWNTTLGDAIAGDDDDIRQVLKNMDLENFPLEINPGLSGGISGGAYFDTKGNTPLKIALKYRNPELALHELSKTKSQQMQFLDAHNAELSQLDKSDPTYQELKDRIAYRQKYVDSLDKMIAQAERGEDVDMPLPQVDYISQTEPRTSAEASDTLLHETTHVGMGMIKGPTGATMEDSYAVVGELFRLQNKNPADMTTEELEKLQHPAVQKLISGVGKTEIMDPDLGHYHLYKQSFGEGLARAAGRKYTDPTQNMAQLVAEELPYGGVTNQQVKAAADVLGVPFAGTEATFNQAASGVKKNFNRWFQGSVATDEKGAPKVFYHGTTKKPFNEFGTPSFFSDSPLEAGVYTGHQGRHVGWEPFEVNYDPSKHDIDLNTIEDGISLNEQFWEPEKIYAIIGDQGSFIEDGKILTPYDLYYHENKINEFGDPILRKIAGVKVYSETPNIKDADERIKLMKEGKFYKGFTQIRKNNEKAKTNPPKSGSITPVYLSIKNPKILGPFEANKLGKRLKSMSPEEVKNYIDDLKKQGYDGIKTESDIGHTDIDAKLDWGGIPENYIPFYPEQIKSIWNRGTFDPENSDYLSSLKPQTGLLG